MLIEVATGVPVFDATVFSITRYRRGSASTMEQALRGAMFLHEFCRQRGIALAQRVVSGAFFADFELDDLAAVLAAPTHVLLDRANVALNAVASPRHAVIPTRAHLLRTLPTSKRIATVDQNTQAIRLHYLVS